jgi:1-deoxy-D-xylulose-5-phosphate reductoisomerase
MIEYVDNSVIAQLGVPDMRIPIQYAITYPKRYPSPVKQLSFTDYGKLTFFEPDYETFKCLRACKEAINRGGLCAAAANGANEVANKLFRERKISFLDIGDLVMEAMLNQDNIEAENVEDVLNADKKARGFVLNNI